MKNILEVKHGSIYKEDSIIIEELAFILDKEAGLMKWGEKENLDKYYQDMIKKYRSIPGLEEFADNQIYIDFSKYNTILTKEEICTLGNYIITVSANGRKIIEILNMNEAQMKEMISKLQELGF